MIVLMNLLEKNNEYVIYSYGYEENKLDGRIKIYLDDFYNLKLQEKIDITYIMSEEENYKVGVKLNE